ncbi:hypothetical protein PDG61_20460 [Mycolicibacterium sp. BiH015]|uniref:hypothetical protein n=1 Tax=Mycolicibacterium sp. BiH015 TaxID=3018808 RepID=UPI0022E86F84|nr:hypothetical protein [Mycolicibacterium sp. BiH015]MDA2893301.1 hypothetical protein [Mycolicibacterium sp. BiH015]
MSTSNERLSVPPRRTRPPRTLTAAEDATLMRVADTLIPEVGANPKASDAREFGAYLQLALAARADVFESVLKAVAELSDVADEDLYEALKEMWATDKFTFDPLSSIIAGAYFMTPQVKELIGYPGQHRDPAGLEDAANELETGILEPVLERGYIYVSVAGE